MRNHKYHTIRFSFLMLALCATIVPALAQEPVGCDKFKWSLDKERATLIGTDLPRLASASKAMWPLPFATMIALAPVADAKLPVAPERAAKSNDTFAGFIEVPAPAKAGTFAITLSAAAWIDVVQNGARLKSIAATGATGCDGVRKSVKFELAAAPFTVQLSGVEANSIKIAISKQ